MGPEQKTFVILVNLGMGNDPIVSVPATQYTLFSFFFPPIMTKWLVPFRKGR